MTASTSIPRRSPFRYFLGIPVCWVVAVFALPFFLPSCKENPASAISDTDSLLLKAGEADLTELTLSLNVAGVAIPAPVTLTRNGEPVAAFTLHQTDTSVIQTDLIPSTDYTWQALLERPGKPLLKSTPLKTRTMDTTSHEFTWKVDSLPGYGSAFDLTIINENNIWVVGDFSTEAFGAGERFNAYNWDGIRWDTVKIPIQRFSGAYGHYQINSMIGFSESDIWVVSGATGSFSHYNGVSWTGHWIEERAGGINKIWGLSSNNFYIVGTNGSITHWNGTAFTLIPSGTTIGLIHATTVNNGEVWMTGLTSDYSHSILLRLDNIETKQIGTGIFNGIWGEPGYNKVWMYHNGYFKVLDTRKEGFNPKIIDDVDYWIRDISGASRANIFIVGDFGAVYHFNGSTVKFYPELLRFDMFREVKVNENMVVACGELNYKPIVITGHQKR